MSNAGLERYRDAAYGLYAVASANFAFIGVGLVGAPREKLTIVAVVGTIVVHAFVTAVLIWLGREAARGKKLMGGACVLMFFILGHGVALVAALAGKYVGGPVLAATHVLLGGVVVIGLVLLVRAQLALDRE